MESVRPIRIRLLGGEVDLITPHEVMNRIEDWVVARRSAVIANHNAHSLYLIRRSPQIRAFFDEADLIEVDSTPMIAWGRLLGLPIGPQHRSTYLDWRDDFWRRACAHRWRVFYLGGAPGVAARACDLLCKRWPGLKLAGRDGYFDMNPTGPENRAVVDQIVDFAPNIVLVGMGMPRQELWILQNRMRLPPVVLLSVGAAFDYEAGAQVAAPRWMGRMGVEWLFRLVSQPRRLGYRYLVEPWRLLPAAYSDLRARLLGA